MRVELIDCSVHGFQGVGLLCKHLTDSFMNQSKVGFYSFNRENTSRPDAWCLDCENEWRIAKTDEERVEWFAVCDFKSICSTCWDEVKEFNVLCDN